MGVPHHLKTPNLGEKIPLMELSSVLKSTLMLPISRRISRDSGDTPKNINLLWVCAREIRFHKKVLIGNTKYMYNSGHALQALGERASKLAWWKVQWNKSFLDELDEYWMDRGYFTKNHKIFQVVWEWTAGRICAWGNERHEYCLVKSDTIQRKNDFLEKHPGLTWQRQQRILDRSEYTRAIHDRRDSRRIIYSFGPDGIRYRGREAKCFNPAKRPNTLPSITMSR